MSDVIKKTQSPLKSESFIGYMFILPCLILLVFMALLPILLSGLISLTDWGDISNLSRISFAGLDNYKELFHDGIFFTAVKNNLLLALFTIPAQMLPSFIIAVLINKYCFTKNLFKIVYFLPYISSTVAIATVWTVLLQPSYGPITEFLLSLGVQHPPKWLVDLHWALPSLAGMVVWQGMGYDIVIYMAALQSIPNQMYESADIDGANWFIKIIRITIPMITPTIFFLMIAETIGTFRIFDQVSILTQGGPGNATQVLVYYLYTQAFKFHNISYGAAITVILFIIVFLITLIQWHLRKKWVQE